VAGKGKVAEIGEAGEYDGLDGGVRANVSRGEETRLKSSYSHLNHLSHLKKA